MQRLLKYSLLWCLLAILPPAAAVAANGPQPVDAQTWVKRIIAAYGGRNVLEKVHTLVYQGKIKALMGRGEQGTETISLQRPRKLRTVIRYHSYTEQRIFNGQVVWRSFGAGFQKTTGPGRLAVIYQYKHLDLPMGLLDGHYRITLGETDRQGVKWPVLHLQDGEGPPMLVTIDPATALIHRVAGVFEIQGQTTRLAVEYEDYRKQGKIPLPHKMVNYAEGMKIAVADFDHVQVNGPLTAGLFHP